MIEGILAGFGQCLMPMNLFLIFIGTALGLLVGALPGFSSPMAIVVLLPLTYHMNALPALLVMIGVYVGTKLGGSFPAILLRTPGTPAGACTALDGYPMAQKGEAGKALGYATMGSTFVSAQQTPSFFIPPPMLCCAELFQGGAYGAEQAIRQRCKTQLLG
jgi:putative tricarboxylic transport membrane protein